MNLKKLDEKNVMFIDEPWTDDDRKQFSEFLQKRKIKAKEQQLLVTRKRRAGAPRKTV